MHQEVAIASRAFPGNTCYIFMQNFPTGITVVIPCLNEEITIARAVADAKAGILRCGLAGEVVVVDNGSTDQSVALALREGARLLIAEKLGYGSALTAGISAANFRYVFFADADLSYSFLEMPKLIAALHDGAADLVLGSRLNGTIESGAMPILNRYLGTPFLTWLIRMSYQMPTSDCNSGMRALMREKYQELNLRCSGMEFSSEMLVRAAQKNWRYAEVPIHFYKDQRGRSPHMKRWRDGFKHLRFIIGNRVGI